MKTQATRLTRKEARYWDYWTAQGYIFAPGEKPPLTTLTAPTRTLRHPIRDALMGLVIIAAGFCLLVFLVGKASRLI